MISKLRDAISTAFVLSSVDKSTKAAPKAAEAPKTELNAPQQTDSAAQAEISKAPEAAETGKFGEQQEKGKDEQELDEKTVMDITEELNKLMSEINCDIEFKYSKEVNLMSVKMVDKETQEVIKEFPPEEMIEGMIKAREWLGAFLDKEA